MKKKTVKMSTRKGGFILLEDVMNRSVGEAALIMMEGDEHKKAIFTTLLGAVVTKFDTAVKNGDNKIELLVSDHFEHETTS